MGTNKPIPFENVVEFHGHACPGLALGYRAAVAAMQRLSVNRAEDEDLVAVVENDACGVDAVQFICGCTFGKGNLIFHDYGKHVYTFFNRTSGKGVRIYVEPPEHPGESVEANAELERKNRINWVLSRLESELMRITDTWEPPPKKARIHASLRCDACGEHMMETRSRRVGKKVYCLPCASE